MPRSKRKPAWEPRKNPNETPLYSWRPDRRATRSHIRQAIHHALVEKRQIGTKGDEWYSQACTLSQQWRDEVRACSIKQLAREHLEYWRLRAFLGVDVGSGWSWDRPAHLRWLAHAATTEPRI